MFAFSIWCQKSKSLGRQKAVLEGWDALDAFEARQRKYMANYRMDALAAAMVGVAALLAVCR